MKKTVIIGDGPYEKVQEIEYRELSYDTHIGRESRWHVGDIEFDGHHTLWGFEYFPTTYLKSSGLSGDEYRKGGEIRVYRDRKQVYSTFVRETERAISMLHDIMSKLQSLDWDKIQTGQKIYYENTPCTIGYVMMNQGAFMLKADDGHKFPRPGYAQEHPDEHEKDEDSEVKVDVLSHGIWWYRK